MPKLQQLQLSVSKTKLSPDSYTIKLVLESAIARRFNNFSTSLNFYLIFIFLRSDKIA